MYDVCAEANTNHPVQAGGFCGGSEETCRTVLPLEWFDLWGVCVCVLADVTWPGAELHVGCRAAQAVAVNSDALWGHFLCRSDMCCHLSVVGASICWLNSLCCQHTHTWTQADPCLFYSLALAHTHTHSGEHPLSDITNTPPLLSAKKTIRMDRILNISLADSFSPE